MSRDMLAAIAAARAISADKERQDRDAREQAGRSVFKVPRAGAGAGAGAVPAAALLGGVKLTAAQKMALMARSRSVGFIPPLSPAPVEPLRPLPPLPNFLNDAPTKTSRWTRQFRNAQGAGEQSAFRWTRYHKTQLAQQLAQRLRARGVSRIDTPDGGSVDFIELLARDRVAAGNLAAAIANAVTTAAQQAPGGKPLTYEEAAAAAAAGAGDMLRRNSMVNGELEDVELGAPDGAVGGEAPAPPVGASGFVFVASVLPPAPTVASSSDFLSILPHETIKPLADCYMRARGCCGCIGPAWHAMMHFCELPVELARRLTVPMMHTGSYRRRLVCLIMPTACAFFVFIVTTHIIEGGPTDVAGVPYAVIAAVVGELVGLLLYFAILPGYPPGAADDLPHASEATKLLDAKAGGAPPRAPTAVAAAAAAPAKKRPWYKRFGLWLAGPNNAPLPGGITFGVLLMLSFVIGLFWLLIIATEIVGVAICFGKILSIPDIIMGLTVLAVGNSINDLAASLTIARDGYASMAVAGAYAGPMFNVLAGEMRRRMPSRPPPVPSPPATSARPASLTALLSRPLSSPTCPAAGIGLPMLLATAKTGQPYAIGKPTLIVWIAYAALIVPLIITLVWVAVEKWRMTHRLGRFLCAWCVTHPRAPPASRTLRRVCIHLPSSAPLTSSPPRRFFGFIILVCALGFSGVSAGDSVVLD